MKLTHKLCGAVLLAAVGVAMATPGITKAADENGDNKQFDGEMNIEFSHDTDKDTDTSRETLTDSDGNSDTEIISGEITREPVAARFGIRDVTPLDFGARKAVADGGVREYWAKNYTEPKGVMANNVLVKDGRTDVADHTYTVKAQITTPLNTMFENEKRELKGATITYNNIGIKTNVDAGIALSEDSLVAKTGIVVGEGTQATFVDNKGEAGAPTLKGQGEAYIHFGKLTAEGEQSSEESVKLTIPKDQTLFQGKYSGVVTWYMENAK
ncbi:hypothetical protein IGJ55_000304 [Enterococcus sp. AZ170]|uniref:WxL domain-containing protein n=1 Tax=Enterococcus sp. AZ170 TaxID=2774747 RepID=UPI003D2FDDC5